MADQNIKALCVEILRKIDENGFYLLPIGFNFTGPETSLHTAFRQLRNDRMIGIDSVDPDTGFEKWVRSSS